ncbi:cell wall / vacuolar inhibitor of fructosidase 2 [Actinidia eriantha]|uniref:cell wall / vacuolar inhibitor of fructosidase 2 n=1 Tax=Actinidia eriantha TaxID=165200 RepID=UPI00258A00D8|nr:cell wall / vacuolar inhibitor of fructosidase 2 [Actinidia eriantha]
MGSSSWFLLFLFSITSLHFHQPIVTVRGDTDLIEKTCKSTKHYGLCVSSLKSNTNSLKSDTKGLAVIMVGVGIANATATSSFLSSQLLSATTNDPLMRKVLKDCTDKYSYAGNSLQASLQDLATQTYDYAYVNVMAAADYPNACHNGFRRYPGLAYPAELAVREDGLKHICDVVLGIIDLL